MKCNNCSSQYEDDEIGSATVQLNSVCVAFDEHDGQNVERIVESINLCSKCLSDSMIAEFFMGECDATFIRKATQEDLDKDRAKHEYDMEINAKWLKANKLGLVK